MIETSSTVRKLYKICCTLVTKIALIISELLFLHYYVFCYTHNIGNPYSCEKVKWNDKRFMNMCAILFQIESWTHWVQVGHLGSFSQKVLLYCVIMNNFNMFECILQYLDFRPSVQHLLIPTIMCTCGYGCHIHVCHIMVKFVSMNLQFSVIYKRDFLTLLEVLRT